MADRGRIDRLAIEEAVVLIADVAGFAGEGDLLGQPSAERVGARDDHALVHAEFEERIAHRRILAMKSSCGTVTLPSWWPHCFSSETWFSIWMQQAPASMNFLAKQIRRLGIAEARVDIGHDRHDVRFMGVDIVLNLGRAHLVASRSRRVEIAEQLVQLARIGLAQEGVEFLDQRRNAGLLVHRLIGQRPEFAAQRRDHPAREVEVTPLVVPKCFLMEIIFCWPMKPCQHPSDWV
jgi:hypothetical protein